MPATDTRPDRSLPIGHFSRATGLSIRMLRHYADHGILVPAFTDPRTGYRYYSPRQLRQAGRVRTLRDLGFGVSAIAGLVDATPEALSRALAAHRVELEDEAAQAAARLGQVDALLTRLGGSPLALDIVRVTHPAQWAVTLRRVIATYDHEHELWDDLAARLPREVWTLAAGPGTAFFHDREYRESDVDVEIALPVRHEVTVAAPLVCSLLPARDVVVALMNGPYEQMTETTAAMAAWIDAQGLRMTGEMYNRYLVSPAQHPDPEDWVTEVCLVVAPGPAGDGVTSQ